MRLKPHIQHMHTVSCCLHQLNDLQVPTWMYFTECVWVLIGQSRDAIIQRLCQARPVFWMLYSGYAIRANKAHPQTSPIKVLRLIKHDKRDQWTGF